MAEQDPDRLKLHPTAQPEERAVALGVWHSWLQWFDAQQALGEPKVVQVLPEVHEILRGSLFEDLKTAMRTEDRLNPVRRRALTIAYTIAGMFALASRRTVVLSDDMDAAINLVEKCTRGLQDLDPELGTSELMQLVNLAFRAIRKTGTRGLPRSKLYPVLQAPKAVVDQVIGTLLEEGSIRDVAQRTGKPGRPATRFVSNGPARFAGPPPEPGNGKVIRFPAGPVDKEK